MIVRSCRLLFVIVALLALQRVAASAETAEVSAALPGPLKYRRILVPADRVNDWPNDDQRYLAIDKEEFDRLIAQADATLLGNHPQRTSISAAEYTATVSSLETLNGEGLLRIQHRDSRSTLFPLSPCNIALERLRWASNEASELQLLAAENYPALLTVDQSGELKFDWSLRGNRDSTGALSFSLSFPKALTSTLSLHLPKDLIPVADHGNVTSTIAAGEQRVWRFEFGGQTEVVLKLLKHNLDSGHAKSDLVRQDVTYDFAAGAVEVTAQLRVDVLGEPLREIKLSLDEGLQFIGARYGDVSLLWNSVPSDTNRATLVLKLPEPLVGTNRVIHLAAVASFPATQDWRIPQIHCDSLFWQEGNATLLIPQPLTLKQLSLVECRQTQTGALAAPVTGERVEIQYFSPDARIDIDVAPADARVQIASGVAVRLGEKDAFASYRGTLTASQGERFSLAANVSRNWIIESVDTVPADALSDWTFNPTGARNRSLELRLAKALNPQRPITVLITARRRGISAGQRFSADDLGVVRFSGVQIARELLAVRHSDQRRIEQISPTELRRLDPKQLSTTDNALLNAPFEGFVYDLSPSAGVLQLAPAEDAPQYAADIDVLADVNESSITEAYTIRCTPEQSMLDQVLVHFSKADPQPFEWKINVPGRILQATRLPSPSDMSGGGETWEINIQPAIDAAFELRAERTVSVQKARPVGLAALPKSTRQDGRLTIRAVGRAQPIITSKLRPITLAQTPAREYSTVLASYAYSPGRDALSAEETVSISLTDSKDNQAAAWIWNAQHAAELATDGTLSHQLNCQIENLGRAEISVQLPASSQFIGIWLNGSRVPANQVKASDNANYRVELPVRERFPVLTLRYAEHTSAPRAIATVAIEPPTFDVPVIAKDVQLTVAPEYHVVSSSQQVQRFRSRASWRRCLFGSFGQSWREEIFNPFDRSAWRLLARHDASSAELRPEVRRFLEDFAAATYASDSGSTPALTWAEAVTRSVYSNRSSAADGPTEILIDAGALQDAGILASTRLAAQSDEISARAGGAMLSQYALALVDLDGTLVLTTQKEFGPLADQAPTDGSLPVYEVESDALRTDYAGKTADDRYVDALAWVALPLRAAPPWNETSADEEVGTNFGWNSVRFQSASDTPATVWIINRTIAHAVGWCLFVIAATLAWWVLSGHIVPRLLILSVAGLIALLVPTFLIPLTSKIFLGLLCGFVCQQFVGRSQVSPPQSMPERPKSTVTKFAVSATGGVVLVLAGFAARGQEATEPKKEQPVDVFEVLVPVGENQLESDGVYYLPEPFYNELFRLAQASRLLSDLPLIQSANYAVSSKPSDAESARKHVELYADFDIRVQREQSEIRFAIGGQSAPVAVESVKLDGMQYKADWNSSNGMLLLDSVEPGDHRLQLLLHPQVRVTGAVSDFETLIPPVAAARLKAQLVGAANVNVPSAYGRVAFDSSTNTAQARLGATNRLALRWTTVGSQATTATPVFDVEELFWLKIKPGSVVVDARLKFSVVEGLLQQIQLSADPRLRALPPDPTSAIAAVRGTAGENITLELSRAITDESVDLQFLVTGTSGVGNIRPPNLSVVGARSTTRKLAITVDPLLKETYSGVLTSLPVEDFLKAWGATNAVPVNAFVLPQGQTDWTASVRPTKPKVTNKQDLAVIVGGRRIEVLLENQVTISDGVLFQYRLSIPETLQVETVRLLQDGSERPIQWSTPETGMLVVRTLGPATGQQNLIVEGLLPRVTGKPWSLPKIVIDDSACEAVRARLYRNPEVMLTVDGPAASEPADAVTSKDLLDRSVISRILEGRTEQLRTLVMDIYRTLEGPDLSVTVSPNRPVVRGSQIISVQRTDVGWEAVTKVQFEVLEGIVDSLTFDIPPSWNGPFAATPAVKTEVRPVSGENRKQLVIRPDEPIRGSYSLTIRSPLTVPSGEAARAPEIVLRGLPTLNRYVLLPTEFENRQLLWDRSGLRPAALPGGTDEAITQHGPFTTYEIVTDQFQAALQAVEKRGGRAKIRLATHSIRNGVDGQYLGVSSFDIEPAGLASSTLKMPEGFELVQAMLDGRPALVQSISNSQWSIGLLQSQLPCKVEIIYRGKVNDLSPYQTTRSFVPPALVGLPVDQTLWSVRSGQQTLLEIEGADRLTRAEYTMTQWTALLDILQPATELAVEPQSSTVQAWFASWNTQLASLKASLTRELSGAGKAKQQRELQAKISELDARQTAILLRFGNPANPSATTLSAPQDLWDESFSGDTCVYAISPAASKSLSVRLQSVTAPMSGWFVPVLSFLVLGIAAVTPALRGRTERICRRSPYLLIVLVGVLWWIWLTPSVVGLIIVAAGVVRAMYEQAYFPRDRSRMSRHD